MGKPGYYATQAMDVQCFCNMHSGSGLAVNSFPCPVNDMHVCNTVLRTALVTTILLLKLLHRVVLLGMYFFPLPAFVSSSCLPEHPSTNTSPSTRDVCQRANRPLVVFNPQITNTIASDASPMRDEYYLPEHRPLVVFKSQNVDLINSHALPSMRDEDYLPEHRPLVVFRSQTINPPSATCPQSLHNATWADFLRFTLCLPLRVPRSVLRHISRCYTLCRPPLFCLLVNLVCDIYAILKCAYVFDECCHTVAVLVRVALMHFCLHSHDFVALLCKTMLKLLCSPLSILQNLSCSCTSLCLPHKVIFQWSLKAAVSYWL